MEAKLEELEAKSDDLGSTVKVLLIVFRARNTPKNSYKPKNNNN